MGEARARSSPDLWRGERSRIACDKSLGRVRGGGLRAGLVFVRSRSEWAHNGFCGHRRDEFFLLHHE